MKMTEMKTRIRNNHKMFMPSRGKTSRAISFRIGFIIAVLLLGHTHTKAVRPKYDTRHATNRYLNEDDDRHGTDPEEEDASNGPVSGYTALVSKSNKYGEDMA